MPTNVAMTYNAAGYLGVTSLSSDTIQATYYLSGAPLYSNAEASNLLATEAKFTYPSPTTGFARVHVEGAVGATITLTPASGNGPVYTATDGTPDPALTSTSTSTYLSMAYFGDLAPGTYTFTASATGKTCYDRPAVSPPSAIDGDWPPSGSGTMALVVTAGAMTDYMHIYCF